MLGSLKTLSESAFLGRGQRRTTGWLLGVAGLAALVVAATYHTVWMMGRDFGGQLVSITYETVVVFGYVVLYLFVSDRFAKRPTSSIRVFWSPLIAGIGFVLLQYAVTRIGRPVDILPVAEETVSLGFEYGTGRPLVPATVFKMNVLSLAQATFAFILMLRFRDLVLVKRTRSSQRNWYVMIGLMVFASIICLNKEADADPTVLQRVALIPAVGFMVVNSLRLSWIPFLSMSEKVVSIGLSLILLIILVGIGFMEESFFASTFDMPVSHIFLRHYSYPLSVFVSLATIFGILYCTTALLSLLFHLPTTSDFQQKAGELAAMHSLTNLVSQVFDPDQLYSTIAASPISAGAGSASWLAIRDRTTERLTPTIVATNQVDASRVHTLVDVDAFYGELLEKREPILLDQAPADHRVLARPGDGIGSLLVVPLTTREEVLGALFVSKEVTHGFEHDDTEAIGVFAAQAALALDNAWLFEERIEKERLSRELAIAREVQRKLLPQSLPKLSGLSMAASSVPAQEVGGDYFDFIRLDEDRLAFIVADVSGKGTSAAFYMAEMQGIFRSVSRIADSPCDFLTHANTALSGSMERNVFISVIYGVMDTQLETVTLARAGHCPAALVGVSGKARYLRSRGMGLGLDRGPLFGSALSEENLAMQAGDVFLFYTDGVVESRNDAGHEYGYDRLLRLLAENRHEDADGIHSALVRDLGKYLGRNELEDDTTIVVLKWQGVDLDVAAIEQTIAASTARA